MTHYFSLLAQSGQIRGYQLSRQRAVKALDRSVIVCLGVLTGLYVGWLLWG